MNVQGAPEASNLRGTLFLRECASCGELAELVNGLAPGDDRICVGWRAPRSRTLREPSHQSGQFH